MSNDFDDFSIDDAFKPEIAFENRKKAASRPPDEDLSDPAAPKGTDFYLTVSTPHTDGWEWHGPFPSFAKILLIAQQVARDSPSALATLEHVKSKGFTKLVVKDPIDETQFSVLEIVTMTKAEVLSMLPKPVFTVLASGPMLHDYSEVYGKVMSANAKGRTINSKIIGSFTNGDSARTAAKNAMRDLIANEDNAPEVSSSFPAADAGGGLIMAMNPRAKWEVRVYFETDATCGMQAHFDEDEANLEKGRKSSWRPGGV
ncbi:hypothetical protein PSPO01_01098 [Paraphaeosphaeria sporulosa]